MPIGTLGERLRATVALICTTAAAGHDGCVADGEDITPAPIPMPGSTRPMPKPGSAPSPPNFRQNDPDNAAAYDANAATAQTAIATLDAALTAQLAPLHDKPFVVFHDALRLLRRPLRT